MLFHLCLFKTKKFLEEKLEIFLLRKIYAGSTGAKWAFRGDSPVREAGATSVHANRVLLDTSQ